MKARNQIMNCESHLVSHNSDFVPTSFLSDLDLKEEIPENQLAEGLILNHL